MLWSLMMSGCANGSYGAMTPANRHGIAIAASNKKAKAPDRSRPISSRPARRAERTRSGKSAFIAQSRIEDAIQQIGDDGADHDECAAEYYRCSEQWIIATCN